MKSSLNKSWNLSGGSEIQSWKPDEIFPSLTAEDMSTVIDDMLKLFQPQEKETSSKEEQDTSDNVVNRKTLRSTVTEWKLDTLEAKVENSNVRGSHPVEGKGSQVPLVQNEKQRYLADTKHQADEIIQNAKNSVDEMILAANKEAESIRKEAYEAGRMQAVAELQKTTKNAQIILNQLSVWREETIRQSEPLIIDMIQKIANLMFGEGILLSNEQLQQNLNKVMRMAQSLGELRVYLNQQDLMILDPEWKKFQESLLGKKIQIVPSDTILPGGCYINGDMGVVDARVETQLVTILEALNPESEETEGIVT